MLYLQRETNRGGEFGYMIGYTKQTKGPNTLQFGPLSCLFYWLGRKDSNLNLLIQSQLSYR